MRGVIWTAAVATAFTCWTAAADAHSIPGMPAPDVPLKQVVGETTARSLKDLRGKPVFIVWFKCNEADSVTQAGRAVDFQKKLGDTGLVILGLSDDPVGEIAAFEGRNGVFLAAVDPAFKAKNAFGAHGVPTGVLLSPSHRVVWAGRPGDCGQNLVEAEIKKQLPDCKTDWAPQLAKVNILVKARRFGSAWKAAEKVADKVTEKMLAEVKADLTKRADAWRKMIQGEADAGYTSYALELLEDLAGQYKGCPIGDAVSKQISEWKADAKIKVALKAGKQMATGLKLELAYKYAAAAGLYKKVIKKYADTKEAKRAQARFDRIKDFGLAAVNRTCDDCRIRRSPCEAHNR